MPISDHLTQFIRLWKVCLCSRLCCGEMQSVQPVHLSRVHLWEASDNELAAVARRYLPKQFYGKTLFLTVEGCHQSFSNKHYMLMLTDTLTELRLTLVLCFCTFSSRSLSPLKYRRPIVHYCLKCATFFSETPSGLLILTLNHCQHPWKRTRPTRLVCQHCLFRRLISLVTFVLNRGWKILVLSDLLIDIPGVVLLNRLSTLWLLPIIVIFSTFLSFVDAFWWLYSRCNVTPKTRIARQLLSFFRLLLLAVVLQFDGNPTVWASTVFRYQSSWPDDRFNETQKIMLNFPH